MLDQPAMKTFDGPLSGYHTAGRRLEDEDASHRLDAPQLGGFGDADCIFVKAIASLVQLPASSSCEHAILGDVGLGDNFLQADLVQGRTGAICRHFSVLIQISEDPFDSEGADQRPVDVNPNGTFCDGYLGHPAQLADLGSTGIRHRIPNAKDELATPALHHELVLLTLTMHSLAERRGSTLRILRQIQFHNRKTLLNVSWNYNTIFSVSFKRALAILVCDARDGTQHQLVAVNRNNFPRTGQTTTPRNTPRPLWPRRGGMPNDTIPWLQINRSPIPIGQLCTCF